MKVTQRWVTARRAGRRLSTCSLHYESWVLKCSIYSVGIHHSLSLPSWHRCSTSLYIIPRPHYIHTQTIIYHGKCSIKSYIHIVTFIFLSFLLPSPSSLPPTSALFPIPSPPCHILHFIFPLPSNFSYLFLPYIAPFIPPSPFQHLFAFQSSRKISLFQHSTPILSPLRLIHSFTPPAVSFSCICSLPHSTWRD